MHSVRRVIAVVVVVVGALFVPSAASATTPVPTCGHLTTFTGFVDPTTRKQGTIQAPTVSVGDMDVNCTLAPGDQSWGVVALQLGLNACTNAALTVNGVYDTPTKNAVTWMQASIGLPATGVYDPVTRDKGAVRFAFHSDDGTVTQCYIVPSISPATAVPPCGHLTTLTGLVDPTSKKTGTMQLPTTSADSGDTRCTLARGDQGWGVVALQLALNACANATLTVNGVYDAPTENVVLWMQATIGLSTAAGVYNPATRSKGAVKFPFHSTDGTVTSCVVVVT